VHPINSATKERMYFLSIEDSGERRTAIPKAARALVCILSKISQVSKCVVQMKAFRTRKERGVYYNGPLRVSECVGGDIFIVHVFLI
jgi:hypothetical protein